MNQLIEREVVGAPVKLKLRDGREFPIGFSMGVVMLFKQLTGINLFVTDSWKSINAAEDPEKFLQCAWAAMHVYDSAQNKLVAPISMDELGSLVDFGNLAETAKSIGDALIANLPQSRDGAGTSPNVETTEQVA